MSFTFHRGPRDWLLSDKILEEVGEALEQDVEIVTDYDVAYVGGYPNKQGKGKPRFYIDHALPKGYDGPGGFINIWVPIILHEAVEDGLRRLIPSMAYQLSHQCALRAERAYIEAMGESWASYNAFCNKQIKKIGSRPSYPNCPPDLDLSPYYMEEDWATLKKMSADGKALWNGSKAHPDVV